MENKIERICVECGRELLPTEYETCDTCGENMCKDCHTKNDGSCNDCKDVIEINKNDCEININHWGIIFSDEQVKSFIKNHMTNLLNINKDIEAKEIINVYNLIIGNNKLNDRSKLFYLDSLENDLIKSRIRNTEDLVRYKESLFK